MTQHPSLQGALAHYWEALDTECNEGFDSYVNRLSERLRVDRQALVEIILDLGDFSISLLEACEAVAGLMKNGKAKHD